MARIAGVDLPRETRVEIGLTYIYGIGRASSNKILAEAGVNPDTRVRELTDDEAYGLIPIREVISNNNVDVSGYCFPEFGVVTPSDETLETIREVYGEVVAECVQTFGLPVAYYDAKDLKDALSKQDIAVKGLNN